MNGFNSFRFINYAFDQPSKSLTLTYGYDDKLSFNEIYHFDFAFKDYDPVVLDRAIQNLFFIAGVSYFKAFLPGTVTIECGQTDEQMAVFLSKTYQRGLGEFFYVNKLDPRTAITFPVHSPLELTSHHTGTGLLIGIGGGKDSLVSVEAFRDKPNVATWSVGHRDQLAPLIERIGLPHFWVDRQIDPGIKQLSEQGALNGHIPISAVFAAVGAVVAVLAGYRDVVVSNEHSANEETLQYQGVSINHQYSKSLEFERDWQAVLNHQFGDTLQYYSFLRPLGEMRIAEAFAATGFERYKDVFSSCNRAFTQNSPRMYWCGECPKCAFVYLILSSFIHEENLRTVFGGKNLLLEPGLEPTFRQLLGIDGDKPLECVGEIQESRQAMHRALARYAELRKYTYELDRTYNYKTLQEHAMPAEAQKVLKEFLDKIDQLV